MSYTTILAVSREGHETIKELHNSWGSAPFVWDKLCSIYLDDKHWFLNRDNAEALWALARREDIPFWHRSVLVMTFDRAYITRDDFGRAAGDIRQFLADFPPEPGHINHWDAIADLLSGDPSISAIGFWHTSVSENPFDGQWNEEAEDYDPLDWSTTINVYEELAAITH